MGNIRFNLLLNFTLCCRADSSFRNHIISRYVLTALLTLLYPCRLNACPSLLTYIFTEEKIWGLCFDFFLIKPKGCSISEMQAGWERTGERNMRTALECVIDIAVDAVNQILRTSGERKRGSEKKGSAVRASVCWGIAKKFQSGRYGLECRSSLLGFLRSPKKNQRQMINDGTHFGFDF